jgi:hypothetical protein
MKQRTNAAVVVVADAGIVMAARGRWVPSAPSRTSRQRRLPLSRKSSQKLARPNRPPKPDVHAAPRRRRLLPRLRSRHQQLLNRRHRRKQRQNVDPPKQNRLLQLLQKRLTVRCSLRKLPENALRDRARNPLPKVANRRNNGGLTLQSS